MPAALLPAPQAARALGARQPLLGAGLRTRAAFPSVASVVPQRPSCWEPAHPRGFRRAGPRLLTQAAFEPNS